MAGAKISLVIGVNEHDATDIIKAFRHRKRADALRDRCQRWAARCPVAPSSPADEATADEWNRYFRRLDLWEKRDPARLGYKPDRYEVRTVPFDGVVI